MIRYTLRCEEEHEFEVWFRSIADCERITAAGETVCPFCDSREIEKALMAPAVPRPGKPASAERVTLASAPDPKQIAMREALKELRRQVTENADYVGDRFADEARKMHYKEVEPRGIYGEATGEEAKKLEDEGIEFQALPVLPDERN
jgi:hypothetical protein